MFLTKAWFPYTPKFQYSQLYLIVQCSYLWLLYVKVLLIRDGFEVESELILDVCLRTEYGQK